MFVHVVDLDPAAPGTTASCELDDFDFGPAARRVLWVPVPSGLDVGQLDNFLVEESPAEALRSDVAVLGMSPEVAAQVADQPAVLDDVSSRIEGAPLYIVEHDEAGAVRLSYQRNDRVDSIDGDALGFLAAMRQADVSTVVRRAGSELPQHDMLHYEGPNRQHYSAFLRVGLSLRSTAELDRVAFWLAPMFKDKRCILVDHGALLALAYRLVGYQHRLGGDLNLAAVESVAAYDESEAKLARRIELAFPHAGRRELGIVVSVTSTGDMIRKMLAAAASAGFEDVPAVAICRTPAPDEEQFPALAVLDETFERHDTEHCADCLERESIVVPIQRDTYLLALSAYVHPEAVAEPDAQDGKRFMEKYADTGVASVHRDHSDSRHHAFYLDVEKIVDKPVFRETLAERLGEYGWAEENIDLVISPKHRAAERLAAVVAETLGVRAITVDERDLDTLSKEDQQLVLTANRICIVDDVVITGNRLYGYRNHIIRKRRRHDMDGLFHMYALVGVARPTDDQSYLGARGVTHHWNRDGERRFIAVEKLMLPNWNEHRCPWCDEEEVLAGLDPTLQQLPAIEARIKRLSDPEGLQTDLFLPWTGDNWPAASVADEAEWPRSEDELIKDRYFELNRGSVFGDLQDAELMLSVAAAMQKLRNRPRVGGRWGWSRLDEVFRSPVAKILSPELYLTGRYYEPVLVACFLRSAHRHDLRAPMEEQDLIEAVNRHLLKSATSDELRTELLLAAARGVLPLPGLNLGEAVPPPADSIRGLAEELIQIAARR